MYLILALERLRNEELCEFEASLVFMPVLHSETLSLKTNTQTKTLEMFKAFNFLGYKLVNAVIQFIS